jgi:hypothetical protein
MKRLKTFATLLLSLALLASCGNSAKKEEESSDSFDLESYIRAAEAIDPDLERVEQVFNILDMVDAGYYDVLTNDPYRAHSYKTSYPVAAANLGIYMADILYHLYGGDNESMFLTFAAAQELAKFIGIESEFASWTIENLEGSIMERDTITMLFNSLLTDSEKYNSEQEMVFVHTAFLTGSFVEKVHISSNLLKQKMNTEEISNEEESNIKELLVIYLNQLSPSTGILYEAFEKQQEQLEDLVVINTFEKLKELSSQLKGMKASLVAAPVSELTVNQDLNTTFELISNLRNLLVLGGR